MPHLRNLSPRLRRQIVLANVCLAIGLLLWACTSPVNATQRITRDGIVGFMLGLSITANLLTVIKARRCQSRES